MIETATVPTFFAKIFGITTINVTATASASASGALPIPYHIMMVLDTTNSMGSGTDTGCTTGSRTTYSPEQCAQIWHPDPAQRPRALRHEPGKLRQQRPAVDEVGLMVFPGTCSQALGTVESAPTPRL